MTAVGAVGYASKQVSHVVVAVKHTVSNTVSPSPPKPPVRRPVAPAPAGSASSQYKGAPKVTGFEPKAACPGQQITIFGSGFKKATAVFIGGHSAKFRISSDGVIHATVPNGFTGGSVTVVSAKGPGTAPHSLKLKFKGCHRT